MLTVTRKKTRLPFMLIMLGLVSLFTDAATEMIYPLIPAFIFFLGAGPDLLGIIEGVAETTASLLKLLFGVISDRMKNKKHFALLGYGISTIFRPIVAVVSAAWQIVIVRGIDRVGKGIHRRPAMH